jgi:Zn-dependent protease with chaperone function
VPSVSLPPKSFASLMPNLPPDSPEAFAARVRNALIKSLVIPAAVLVFFAVAPRWLNHRLHDDLNAGIERQSSLSLATKSQREADFAKIDFETVCENPPTGTERLRQKLDAAGITGQFQRLRWGLYLSLLQVGILLGGAFATSLLARRALQSQGDLIASYRWAWRLGTASAIAKVILLIPLLSYGSFELTTLAFGQYFPKLIAVVVIGGCVALWRSFHVLLKRVPLEFQQKMAVSVRRLEAPLLWADVREAAAKIGTTPPDNILVGMDHNFFVTELSIIFSGGRTEGRTLYLSYPLMRQLSVDEVMAIVGHELGHFRGDDTRITREFYPMRRRIHATIHAMAASGWVGWTSLNTLLFFQWSFGRSESATSRQRELEADRIAATLTSPQTMGNALVKTHVFSEAFRLALVAQQGNPFEVPMAGSVRDQLLPKGEYWSQLLEKTTSHPLDTHPPLRVRLDSLGQDATAEAVKAIATRDAEPAFGRWFNGQDASFAGIVAEALTAVNRVRLVHADYATPAGRELLGKQFPEVAWLARRAGLMMKVGLCIVVAATGGFLFAIVDAGWPKAFTACFTILFLLIGLLQYLRHRNGLFVLRPDSLSYAGWRYPVPFSEIGRVYAKAGLGSFNLCLRMKAKGPQIWKNSLCFWLPTWTVVLPVDLIAAPRKEALETIRRYISRQA